MPPAFSLAAKIRSALAVVSALLIWFFLPEDEPPRAHGTEPRPRLSIRDPRVPLISATGQTARGEFAPLPVLRLGGMQIYDVIGSFAEARAIAFCAMSLVTPSICLRRSLNCCSSFF